jgi:hypothetical protein
MDVTTENAGGCSRLLRRAIAMGAALLGAGAASPLAWSEDPPPPPPPPGGPAISQYVETVPSGAGGQAVGVGKSRTKPLPKPAAKKLDQHKTPLAPKLRSVATSSSYGAPQQTLPRRAPKAKPKPTPKPTPARASKPRTRPAVHPTPRAQQPVRPAEPDRTALSAAVSAATGGSERGPMILLGAIVLFTTTAGLLAAARRARQRA